jgi:predicted alpha/beta-fold hydrolase
LRWRIIQRMLWVHGVRDLYRLANEVSRYEISSVVEQIECPTLLTASEGDPLAKSSKTLFDALRCPKTFLEFQLFEGSGGHCEALARSLYHQRVFDWLDEVLPAA